MRTCLYSLTLHFLLTEELRHVIPMGLALQCIRTQPQQSVEENPENPELANTYRRKAGRDTCNK